MKIDSITFRLSNFEKKFVESKARLTGLSTSEFCRKSVLNKKVKQRLNEQELSVYNDLKKYHANFSRISNIIKNSDRGLYDEIKEVKNLIEKHLNKFK